MRVTFCGHKEIDDRESIKRWLNRVCLDLIEQGAKEFYLGGYGEFDLLCVVTLREMQKEYPHIRMILMLPYLNRNIPTAVYDETLYTPLETVPKRFAISRRNEWMVKECDVVVAYVTHGWGGAAKTLAYAEKKKKQIILYQVKKDYKSQCLP